MPPTAADLTLLPALVPIPDPSDYRPLTVDNRLAELRTGAQSSTEVESA